MFSLCPCLYLYLCPWAGSDLVLSLTCLTIRECLFAAGSFDGLLIMHSCLNKTQGFLVADSSTPTAVSTKLSLLSTLGLKSESLVHFSGLSEILIHVVFNFLESFIKWFADCSHCNQQGPDPTKKTCLVSTMRSRLQQTLRVDQTCHWCCGLWCRLLSTTASCLLLATAGQLDQSSKFLSFRPRLSADYNPCSTRDDFLTCANCSLIQQFIIRITLRCTLTDLSSQDTDVFSTTCEGQKRELTDSQLGADSEP